MRYLLSALVMLFALTGPVSAQDRLALVIGNSSYDAAAGGRLANPSRDADTMAAALRDVGFAVTVEKDLDDKSLKRAIRDHRNRLASAGPGTINFFYYAGHGANDSEGQFGGTNYFIPVGANVSTPQDLDIEAVELGDAIRAFANASVSFVVFDACRNYPFAGSTTRSANRGFLTEPERKGTFIAFSSEPGSVALDDSGYAEALATALRTPGLDHTNIFKRVRQQVYQRSNSAQFAWFRDGILGNVVFAEGAVAAPVQSVVSAPIQTIAPIEQQRPQVTVPSVAETAIDSAIRAAQNGDPVEDRMFRDTLSDGSPGPEMVVIPSGSFVMGLSKGDTGYNGDQSPKRMVSVRKFAAARYELSWDEWEPCVRTSFCESFLKKKPAYTPIDSKWGKGDRPIINVSWHDAKGYIAWLNSQVQGTPYRLLTEAEWEYAARAGSTGRYSWGDERHTCEKGRRNGANFIQCDYKTEPVGSYKPNDFGLYDMHGNVHEWVEDCYRRGYENAPNDGAAVAIEPCSNRVARGGSWYSNGAVGSTTFRSKARPNYWGDRNGFRLARDLED